MSYVIRRHFTSAVEAVTQNSRIGLSAMNMMAQNWDKNKKCNVFKRQVLGRTNRPVSSVTKRTA
jgi:hypothetical protein